MVSGIAGERKSGQEVRDANVTAVSTVSNILKSSLGPLGLDKMLVDDIGDVVITNDGNAILHNLEILHPAAKLLVDLSNLQDQEVGDGTTSVVLLAAELLQRGNELVKDKIHPTTVISGYKLAMKEAVKFLEENLTYNLSELPKNVLINISKTTLSSKFAGVLSDDFSRMIVNAVLTTEMKSEKNSRYPISNVNVITAHGKSTIESYLVDGYALHRMARCSHAMPMSVKNAKIAFIDFGLKQHRMQLGVTINVEDPNELEHIRRKEKDIVKDRIGLICAAGANVIFSSEGIDDTAMKYLVHNNIFAVRRVERKHLKRIAKLTGGTVCLTLNTTTGDEAFDSAALGSACEVYEDTLSDWDCVFIRMTHPSDNPSPQAPLVASKACTIVLRGPNDHLLEELERSVHDALCAVSRAVESKTIVVGGGCTEAALSVHLEEYSKTTAEKEQISIAEFAKALLVIPKTLAVNAAQDATELSSILRSHHMKSQMSSDYASLKTYGLHLTDGAVVDNLSRGVIEPAVSKIKSIRFATEAAVTILRIDDFIKLEPEKNHPQQ